MQNPVIFLGIFQKGIEKKTIEMAIEMLKEKENIEKIIKYTKLTREELEKLNTKLLDK